MRRIVCALLLLLVPGVAQAKWLEASSPHFVVFADDDARNVRRFSEQLERFHSAVTKLLEIHALPPSPSNRVTVYIVRSPSQVRKLAGDKTGSVYGFYVPRAGGSIAVVPTVDAGRGELEFSMIALLHEYVHHVTLSNTNVAMPAWMVEGVAEFFASAKFDGDGSIEIGRPATHRSYELSMAKNVSIYDLLEPDAKQGTPGRHDNFYGRSWLLYHYLTLDKARAGQLTDYLLKFNQGMGSIKAAESAFGNLRALNQELYDYMRGQMLLVHLPPEVLAPGTVTLRELSEGEAAMMPVRIRSKKGVDREQALKLLPEAQEVAARYPGDAAVLAALAEAEHDAGHHDAAITAANKALAIDPARVNAYVQKGYALFDKARAESDPDRKAAAYETALQPFLALNKIENDHPLPLLFFYERFDEQGKKPSETAIAALHRAAELAPFDLPLRMTLATQELRDGDRKRAVQNLKPIAYNPHGGDYSSHVRELIDRIEAGVPNDVLFKDGKLDLGGAEPAQAGGEDGSDASDGS